MSVSSADLGQILESTGALTPLTGGPAATLKSTIAQTIPFEVALSANQATTQIMDLTAIYITTGQVITNINHVSGTTAGGTITNWWYALYDDGRGTTTANQLALLGQTPDQTSAAFAASTNIGLALITPYTTTYSGIYYIGFMMKATTVCTLAGITRNSTASIQISSTGTGSIFAGTAGSGLTTTAPSPSGAVTATGRTNFAYVS